ncbi:TolC family protein [Desulfobotulus sp. H1]|uniref:TolC family protein n=1 Tax=Desulfobotulus pelophilus TaxID=2823377 RepID=A0ABT3NA47_9BACT|nr:TolC family protein [Desulfobotulus pelophilus]MCW7753842.1 TolC family protein [Desulfobotulus pelophilus]
MGRYLFFTLCLLLAGVQGWAGTALPVVRIAIVEDGPSARYGGVDRLQKEIFDLVGKEFDIRFPEALHFSGNWNIADIRRELRMALGSQEADMVIGAGVIASHILAHERSLPLPGIGAVVIAADLQQFPESGGSSGVKNLNYIKSFENFERDMGAFRKMVPFDRLAVIGDVSILEAIPDLGLRTGMLGKGFDLEIDFVPAVDDANSVLAAISHGVGAVLVTPLQRFSPEEFCRLVDGFIEKGLPSFSLWGREEVERGILAGMAPSQRIDRLARRVALHVQQILLGREAGTLSVAFYPDVDFTVNMETARRIQVYPDWDVLLEADLIHEVPAVTGTHLSLKNAVQEAMAANLDLALAEREKAISRVLARKERASLRPQAGVTVEGQLTDRKNAAASLGRQPEEEVWAAITLRQILFSERSQSLADVADIEVRSREVLERQVRLDIAETAARAFLNALRADRMARIRKQDLDLTRANLVRAKNRREVGYAGPSEVYRWESRLASARKALLDARAGLRQAEIQLNRVLHRRLDAPVYPEDTRVSDPLFFVSDPRIRWFSENPRRMGVFHDFVVAEARDRSPELEQIALAMKAAERSIRAARRAWYIPELVAEGALRQRLVAQGDGSGAMSVDLAPGLPPVHLPEREDFGWQVGLRASYPVFTGGARPAVLDEGLERLEALRTRRLQTAEGLEARMRVALYATEASWPGIRLSGDAAESARNNMNLVTDAYERGVVSAMDLLDAQHALLVAEEMSAASVYDFLKDLMAVQRLLGNVDFSATLEERDAMFVRLKDYYEKNGLSVPGIGKENKP